MFMQESQIKLCDSMFWGRTWKRKGRFLASNIWFGVGAGADGDRGELGWLGLTPTAALHPSLARHSWYLDLRLNEIRICWENHFLSVSTSAGCLLHSGFISGRDMDQKQLCLVNNITHKITLANEWVAVGSPSLELPRNVSKKNVLLPGADLHKYYTYCQDHINFCILLFVIAFGLLERELPNHWNSGCE